MLGQAKDQISMDLVVLDHCPVCANKARKKIFDIKDSSVFECSFCKLRYLAPCVSADAMASMYESTEALKMAHAFQETYYDYGDLSKFSKTRSDFEKALTILEQHIPAKNVRRIFDVGYGNGFFLALAQKRGWAIDGTDTSPQNAALAKEKFGLNLRSGVWDAAASGGEKYQVVSFWDVLEHFSNPHDMIKKASAILAPGGVILAAVPNDRSFLMYLSSFLYRLTMGRFRKGIEQIYLLEHVCYHHRATLELLFQKNGFEMIGHFYSATDLAKYKFSFLDRCSAGAILALGRLFCQENRLIAFFRAVH